MNGNRLFDTDSAITHLELFINTIIKINLASSKRFQEWRKARNVHSYKWTNPLLYHERVYRTRSLTWEYHVFEYVHVYGEAHVVGPVQPVPPLLKYQYILK